LADFDKAIKRDPGNARSLLSRGMVYHESRQFADAIADYTRAIELDAVFVDAWFHRAKAYRASRQLDRAIADFSDVIRLQPEHKLAWHDRSEAYSAMHKPDLALADMSEAIRLDQKYARAWHDRGMVQWDLGRWGNSLADLARAAELRPDSGLYQNDLAWMLSNCPQPKLRDPRRAVELAGQATKLGPKTADRWNTLGVAHYRAGDWNAAIVALNKSVELRKGNFIGSDAFFLAMAHWHLRQKEEAHNWYKRAVDWMEGRKEELTRNQSSRTEIERFRAEAMGLLGMPPN
jgi:tetratricopeptide (TPR) repeat protein